MMVGEKSHTASHPTGISGNRRTSRTMADGSGNRGQHVNLRVVVVGFTIIRNAPFVHSVSVLCPSQFQQNPQVPNPCVLPVMEISRNSGLVSPKVTLLHSYWLQRTRSIGLGGTLSRRSCSQHRARPRRRPRPRNRSWHKRNLNTTRPPRMRGSWRRSSRNRPRPLRSCGSSSRTNRTYLGGSAQPWHKPRRKRNNFWMICVLCALLCMVQVLMATRILHDRFLWNRTPICSNRRFGCSTNRLRERVLNQIRTIQASLNVSTGCWEKPTPSSSRTRTLISSMSTRVFDEASRWESKSNLTMKEISVVVANIDCFGPATNAFLDSPAANGIAGFMFSEMHVKEQGLVKLRSKFALQGFTARSPQRASLSCRKLVRVAVLRHCSGPI